jgi:hypothetical protein
MAVLCLRGKRVPARLLAMSALAADTVLMFIMFLTATCFDCLVAAAFIGLIYYSLRGEPDGWFLMPSGPSLLLPVWFGLFIGNGILAADEMLPRHVLGNGNAEVSIFFSPSCPACREALVSFGSVAALYPVEEKPEDAERIIKFGAFLHDGLPVVEALERSMDPDTAVPEASMFKRVLLSVQLLRNKTALLRQGFRALPLIRINGMPGFGATPLEKRGGRSGSDGRLEARPHPAPGRETTPPPGQDERLQPDFLQDTDNFGKCGGEATEPCPENPGTR